MPEARSQASNRGDHLERYDQWSREYWKKRCLDSERELERVTDEFDSANERIAQLERQLHDMTMQRERHWLVRLSLEREMHAATKRIKELEQERIELREDGLTGNTYRSFGVGL